MKKTLTFSLVILVGWIFSRFLAGGGAWNKPNSLAASVRENEIEFKVQALQAFELIDDQNGWVITGDHFFYTQDTGYTWMDLTPGWGEGWQIQDAHFIDRDTGWLIATRTTENASDRYILAQTGNQGASWQIEPLDLFSDSDPNGAAAKITLSFVDLSNGWMVIKTKTSANFNTGTLFRTGDGGSSWQRLEIPIGDGAVFTSQERGWTAGGAAGNELYTTTDGGHTWQAITLVDSSQASSVLYQAPLFENPQRGMLPVVTNQSGKATIALFSTKDGGSTWEQLASLQSEGEIAPGVPVPMDAAGDHVWLVSLPITGVLFQVDQDSGQVTLLSRDRNMQGMSRLSAGGLQAIWAGIMRGSCTISGCNQEVGIIAFEPGSQRLKALEIPGVLSNQDNLPHAIQAPSTNPDDLEQVDDLSLTLTLVGQGFDKCEIATLAQFQDWIQSSPYKTTNLYIGGISRACSNQALTGPYLHDLSQQGWRFIPTWVGPQAPCTSYNNKIPTDTSQAYQKGIDEANAAIDKAASLGLTEADKSGSVIYYDLEPMDVTNTQCLKAVRSFFNGWSYQMKLKNNKPGVYSTGPVLNELDDIANPPEVIWPANWYCNPSPDCGYREDASVWNVYSLPNTLWANHQRIRQYSGGHSETWGSTSLTIDSNVIDGLVSDISGALPLWVKKDGTGAGTVTSNPSGVNCGSTCYVNFEPLSMVTLTANPATGSSFVEWKGDCDTIDQNSCSLEIDSYKQVTASFKLNKYPLEVSRDGGGSGKVTSSPAGIDCGTDCSELIDYGTKVTLTAKPETGSVFTGWSGDCSKIDGATCEVTIDLENQVTANFSPAFLLSVGKNGTGSGTVTSTPAGISCGTTCSAYFAQQSEVNLAIKVSPGSFFIGWEGPCTISGTTCKVKMTQAQNVTATFGTNKLFLPFTGKD